MTEAPKKIYWDVQDRIADENQDDPSEIIYIRADIIDGLVEALEELMYARTDKAERMAEAALAKVRGEG